MSSVMDELFEAMVTPGTLVHEGFKQVYGDPLKPMNLHFGRRPLSLEGTVEPWRVELREYVEQIRKEREGGH